MLLLFFVAEIIVMPLGEFPLNDDWAYTSAVITFYKTGEINFGNFPAMSLCTHILWGYAFTKLFGLSFFLLRCSSMLSLIIGLAFLNKLLIQITDNKKIAAFACVLLLFNPLVFNLSNTFMTDVNFNTLIILCFYFAYRFFKTQSWLHYALFLFFSVALVLLRQYGIIVPACFVVACLFLQQKKRKYVLLGLAALVVVIASLKWYEFYLAKTLPLGSAYKFSGNVNLLSSDFWDKFFYAYTTRHKMIVLHLLVYAMPLALIVLTKMAKIFSTKIRILVFIITLLLIYILASEGKYFSHGNIFFNTILGPETFYQSLTSGGAAHNLTRIFGQILFFVIILSSTISLYVLLLEVTRIIQKKAWKKLLVPEMIFLITFILSYAFMLLITESYFDRYHIPLITSMIMVFAYFAKQYSAQWAVALLPLLFWMYVSVFGTKDYFEWNRQRWDAYWYLRREKNISMDNINAGFETNLWHEGVNPGWRNYLDLKEYNYLIQFSKEDGFELLKEYEFQRYFPYKKDKINIFVRQDTSTVKHD